MLIQPTLEKLRQMRLSAMADALMSQAQLPDAADLSFEDRFGLLVEHEWTHRQDRCLARRLKEARLRVAACPEDIDYHQPRGLDKSVMRSLAGCQWVRSHQAVLVTGATGVGKTYIACALAHAACRHGYTARYYRVPRLLGDLAVAKGDGSYLAFLRKLAKIDVLVLDDWGLSPLNAGECREMLEVIDDRSQTRATIVASQLPVDTWHQTMADPSVADAILDRLVHHAHKLALRGESMRKVAAAGRSEGKQ